MDINCPECKHAELEAQVQDRKVIQLRCAHCGWTMPTKKLVRLNQTQATSQPEFMREIHALIQEKDEI